MTTKTDLAQALKPIYAPRVITGDELGALQRVITGCGLPTTQSQKGHFLNEGAVRIQGVWMAAVEWACKAAAAHLAAAPIPPLTAPAPLTSRQKFVNAMMDNAEKWSGSAAPAPQQSELPTNEQVAEVCFGIHPDDYTTAGGPLDALHYDGEVVRTFLSSRAKAAPAAPVQTTPTRETDLSKRLRAIAAAVKPNDPALVTPKCLTDAADEIDRYYGGMLAWKQTAEKKDRDWNAERMGRENDRIAARLAAPVQAEQAQAEPKEVQRAITSLIESVEAQAADFPAGIDWIALQEQRRCVGVIGKHFVALPAQAEQVASAPSTGEASKGESA
jgi:hypothetical protein